MPTFGLASWCDSAEHTGAATRYDRVATPWASSDQAPSVSTSPVPWAVVRWPLMRSAVLVIAVRSAAGVALVPVARAAERSSAAAPVASGAAIEVPLSIEYPGGRS